MAHAAIDELLAEASAPDSSLLEFFQFNLPQLNSIWLKDIQLSVLGDIALCLHGTMLLKTDWMPFLNELGIVDNRAIVYIQFKSKWREELPIYLALRGPLLAKLTFGDVIAVIIKNQRLDVLREIRSYVENLLNKPKDYSWVPKKPTAPECEKEDFQGDSLMNMGNKVKTQNIEDKLTLIETETITILMLHTDDDLSIAEDLRLRLKKDGFSVKTLSDFDHWLMMNAFEIIPALLSAVDFIVPIVSRSFLKQIRSGSLLPQNASFDDLSDEDNFSNNSNNQYIYQLILNEYLHNRCLNFKVRPVMVPDINRKLLKFDVLLTNSYKLWEKVPNFINMLKKTSILLKKITA